MDTEVPGEALQKETERERLLVILGEVSVPVQKLIDDVGIDRAQGELRIDKIYLELLSKKYQFGDFAFWGKLLTPGHAFGEISSDVVAQIQNIRIPQTLRGQGVGSRIVDTWERELGTRGVINFVVTNIKDADARAFWHKRGYLETNNTNTSQMPYFMYKKAPQPEISHITQQR